jgi:hypothetical protein
VISHKIMAMMHESARVQELELELMEIRAAFEEYITSSRELENGLDGELGDMRTLQLDRSMTSENDLTHIANIFCSYQIQS